MAVTRAFDTDALPDGAVFAVGVGVGIGVGIIGLGVPIIVFVVLSEAF